MSRRKPSGVRHANYEALNLIGYGLAKFDRELVAELGFRSKAAWYADLIARGVATTVGTLKNRQDLFNPLVRGTKVGWWQNQDRYRHRKTLLDSLFGDLDVAGYAAVVVAYIQSHFARPGEVRTPTPPLLGGIFRSLQETGREAELFFMSTFRSIPELSDGRLEDARLYGDGYDFQITVPSGHYLAEVKGVRERAGGVRLTAKEHDRAREFGTRYVLAVVSSLKTSPRLIAVFNPLSTLIVTRCTAQREVVYYTVPSRRW